MDVPTLPIVCGCECLCGGECPAMVRHLIHIGPCDDWGRLQAVPWLYCWSTEWRLDGWILSNAVFFSKQLILFSLMNQSVQTGIMYQSAEMRSWIPAFGVSWMNRPWCSWPVSPSTLTETLALDHDWPWASVGSGLGNTHIQNSFRRTGACKRPIVCVCVWTYLLYRMFSASCPEPLH